MNLEYKQEESIALEETILQMRADFSSWLVKKHMFETLCVFAEIKFVVSRNMDSLAAISSKDVQLYLKEDFVKDYERNKESFFFVFMHELRHLVQAKSYRDWKYLVSFYPLQKILRKYLPSENTRNLGLDNLDSDVELKHEIFNLAADAAIHEDIVELFEPGILERVSNCMSEFSEEKNISVSPITVASLERMIGENLEPKQDWLYYAQKLISGLSSRIEKEPNLAEMLVDRNVLGVLQKSLDEHQFDIEDLGSLEFILQGAKEESKKLLDSQKANNLLIFAAGSKTTNDEVYTARKQLNEEVKKIIAMVKKTIVKTSSQGRAEYRTYGMPHRYLKEAPGRGFRHTFTKKALSVVVLDTSASMWRPIFLDQMASVVSQLKSRKWIEKAYCCDSEIYPIETKSSRMMNLRGKGGSDWTVEHNSKILQELNTDQPVNIYYLTDEHVNGLEEAKLDKRVHLTVINIPNLNHLLDRANI